MEDFVMADNEPVDKYWTSMATNSIEALSTVLHPDLTIRRRQVVVEYLANVFDQVYRMGIRAGQLSAKLEARKLESDNE